MADRTPSSSARGPAHPALRLGRRLLGLALTSIYAPASRGRRPLVDPATACDVSLTSFGARLSTVHLAIESIGRGSKRPRRLVLWVDEGQAADLGKVLRRQVRRGLEIRETDASWGPHKKYFPYCLALADDVTSMATADDDVFYQRHWLRDLMAAASELDGRVHCHRARLMALNGDGSLAPYAEWRLTRTSQPSALHLATGVGGVLYPPRLQRLLRDAGRGFLELHARTDDIWLHLIELQGGFDVAQVRDRPRDNIEIPATQRAALARTNQLGGGNDEVLRATYGVDERRRLREASAGRAVDPRELLRP